MTGINNHSPTSPPNASSKRTFWLTRMKKKNRNKVPVYIAPEFRRLRLLFRRNPPEAVFHRKSVSATGSPKCFVGSDGGAGAGGASRGGCRPQGGAESDRPPTLLKVIPDIAAVNVCLNAGDVIAGRSAADSMTHRDTHHRAIVNSRNTLEIIIDRADVTQPSLSVKGHPEVSDLNLEILGVKDQNDLKTSEMTIDEDGLSASSLANSETVINNSSMHDVTTDSIGDDVIQTNSTTSQNQSTSTAPPTPSAIPATPPASPNHQKTPPVDYDTLPSDPVIPSIIGLPSPEICPGDCDSRISEDGVELECGVRSEQKCDDGVAVVMMTMMASETVLSDSSDIPLVQLEQQNSLPVRALVKTSALTSEPGDDNSTEGADDQSSEFSDDISVIEVQTTAAAAAGNDGGAPGERVDNENDDTVRNSGSIQSYQDEMEHREISVVSLNHRVPEETVPPSTETESAEEGAEMGSRMRACFYLPSLGNPGIASKGDDDVVQSTMTKSIETVTRDFSQTAPWRMSCKGPAVVGGSRSDDNPAGLTSVTRSDLETTFQTVTVDRNQNQQMPDYPVTESVIYLPISIIDKQLRLGSEYSFQRKLSPSIASESQIHGRSYPDSLTLTEHVHSPDYYQGVVRSNDDDDDDGDQMVRPSDAVTMTTARVYVAPMTSQSTVRLVPEAEVPAATSGESSLRYSSEVLSELQDIPLPTVRDIVADLNSRLLRVAESHVTSTTGSRSAVVELGTSFGRPERLRRRSSSGSESDKEAIVAALPEFDPGTPRLLPTVVFRTYPSQNHPPPPSSIRRFSLPGSGGANQQRRVRFAEPPESSVIEIEGRRRRADYGSVSSLAEKLDRIELENALASAAMKRSRPFHPHPPPPQQQPEISSLLLAAHHPDIRTASPMRSLGLSRGGTAWRLDPIQERAIDLDPSDTRQFRMAVQGPGSPAGHLNLSHPVQGSRPPVYAPSKANSALPSAAAEAVKSEQFSRTGTGREPPMRYALPPSYEESVLAMATGRHPRSCSSLDDDNARPVSVFPARVPEIRSESQLVSGAFPPPPPPPSQPGIRMIRSQSPSIPGASHHHHHHHHHRHHPGWTISVDSPQDSDHRRRISGCYGQALQMDADASSPVGRPVFHARSAGDPRGRRAPPGEQGRSEMGSVRVLPSGSALVLLPTNVSGFSSSNQMQVRPSSPLPSPPGPEGRRPPLRRPPDPRSPHLTAVPPPLPLPVGEPFRLDRRWNASFPVPLSPTAAQQPPIARGSPRQAAPPASSSAPGRMGADPRGLPPLLQQQQHQRMPGIFALLDKTFTDKVMNWEGSNRSGGLQQSETYKLVREMDNAMKQDKL